jgi:diguanylate cyclase (GGDEF)-like protein
VDRLRRALRRKPADHDGLGFAVRLGIAVVLAIAAVGFAGYFVMLGQLKHGHLARNAAIQRADVKGLEDLGRTSGPRGLDLRRIDDVLDVLGKRPGTLEVTLIDAQYVVKASGSRSGGDVGRADTDPRIAAALRHGASYAGHDSGRGDDRANFEFVSPVELPGGRYALAVIYDHQFLDATVAVVRRTMGLIALLALFGGGLVFYLVGGRALMRSYRGALKRSMRDGLTDMPNQRAFQDEFEQAVALATRHEEPLTLVLLDVDEFKLINDRYGHPHGDTVLRRVAGVLSAGRLGDRAYRLGGDEFALVLPHADEPGARRLALRLSRSLNAADTALSLGVSTLRRGQSAEDLRGQADAALYEAKHRGGNGVAHFDEIRDTVTLTTSVKSDAVRSMIDEGGISTVYQPIWDIDAGVLLGIEALTRPGEEYGLLGPAEAFDIAEQIGQVHQLDELCVCRALHIAPQLPDLALLFINLSPQTLDLDADGNDWMLEAVRRSQVPVSRVVIEVTERFGGRTAPIIHCLQRLRRQGFKLALDDVGTGNSGLEMLRELDVEFVKIDRSIVTAAIVEPASRAVLMAIATYASQTDSLVIAEGIEDQDTLDFLSEIGTHISGQRPMITGGQGYGLGRPTPQPSLRPPELLNRYPNRLPTA